MGMAGSCAHAWVERDNTMLLVLLPALVSTMLVGVAPGPTHASFCTGQQLSGSFTEISGSAGAGNIVYSLRLRNSSNESCAVAGIPAMQLLGRGGRPLPTRVRAETETERTPVLLTIRPRRLVTATARFSPDVPGPGEATLPGGRCEPTAYRLRVAALGGGATTLPVSPPTSVCEHGLLQASAYTG
jgi:hypothetical protein